MIKHSYLSPKVKARPSGIDRRGIFAVRPIKKGEVVCVWGGYVITQKEFDALAKKQFRNIDDYATKVADGFYLVSCKKGGLEDDDFFNHSCDPNCGIQGHLLMTATRNIRRDEELTYDYAMTDADYDYSFKCGCGAKGCRRQITTNDWRDRALRRKYKGYFSWYVQTKIDKSKS